MRRTGAVHCSGLAVVALLCAIAVAGCPSPLGRGLLVYPLALDFGGAKDALTVNVTNQCSDSMVWQAVADQPWVTVTPDSGAGDYTQATVTVTRPAAKAMELGKNTATIRFTSSGGIQDVPVTAWFWPEYRFQETYDEGGILVKQGMISAEWLNDCEVCPDGGYVGVGSIEQTATVPHKAGAKAVVDEDYYMVRVDMEGEKVWSINWGLPGHAEATAMVATNEGDYVVCGYQEIGPEDDKSGLEPGSYVQLTKVSADGYIHWTKTYGDGLLWAWGVKQTPDGGFIVTAEEHWDLGSEWFPILIKTDSEGEVEWTREYAVPYPHDPFDVDIAADGGYIMAGISWPGVKRLSRTGRPGAMTILDKQGGPADLFFLKTDPNGNPQWRSEFGSPGQDFAYSVVALPDGYAACGEWDAFGAQDAVYVVRTDLAGNEVWQDTYNVGAACLGGGIVADGDGALFVSGWRATPVKQSGDHDPILLKVLADGTMDWVRYYGLEPGPDWEGFWRLRLTPDGGPICAGWTQSHMFGDQDAMLVKTDENGFVAAP
ncbi:MAG: BACON domain-containing protein [bacterium]|nr:BACON domain-containing protein [bacterium]